MLFKDLAIKAKNRLLSKGNNNSNLDIRIKIIRENDNDFTDKVRAILASDVKCKNPLKYLMDDRKILKLDEKGRERYLFETMEKYLKAKSMIEREGLFAGN